MPRATNAPASRERRRRVLERAKGFRGSRSKLYRQATEAVDKAMVFATEHRKTRKRDYRKLWIARISAACKLNGMNYSRFIQGITKSNIDLNRKVLANIAIFDENAFNELIKISKNA